MPAKMLRERAVKAKAPAKFLGLDPRVPRIDSEENVMVCGVPNFPFKK